MMQEVDAARTEEIRERLARARDGVSSEHLLYEVLMLLIEGV